MEYICFECQCIYKSYSFSDSLKHCCTCNLTYYSNRYHCCNCKQCYYIGTKHCCKCNYYKCRCKK